MRFNMRPYILGKAFESGKIILQFHILNSLKVSGSRYISMPTELLQSDQCVNKGSLSSS